MSLPLVPATLPVATIAYSGSSVVAFAASELQAYIQQMTGATLPITQTPGHLASGILLVPAGGCADVVLPDARLTHEARDAYTVVQDGRRVLLRGSNDRSVLYAAYDLLEQLGVRFIAPQYAFYAGAAEYVPQVTDLAVAEQDRYEVAVMRYRRKFVTVGYSHSANTLQQLVDWMAKTRHNCITIPADNHNWHLQRWQDWRGALLPEIEQRGLILEVGGHGYHVWLRKGLYQPEHPDWYDPSTNFFVVSNPGAVAQFCANIVAYLQTYPEIAIFDLWPPDGARWADADIVTFGSIANTQAALTEAVRQALDAAGLMVRLEVIAYATADDPPDPSSMYHPSVTVDIAVARSSFTESSIAEAGGAPTPFEQVHQAWLANGFAGDLAAYEYYRKYSWVSKPVGILDLMACEVAAYRQMGMQGIGCYSEAGDWLTYEATHLLLARLAWGDEIDVAAWLDDYLTLRYGAAAGAMAAYHAHITEGGPPLTGAVTIEAATAARAAYVQAQQALQDAAIAAPDPHIAMLFGKLTIGIVFALLETDLKIAELGGDEAVIDAAKQSLQTYVEAHRYDGVIVEESFLIKRYRLLGGVPGIAQIYERYRAAW